MTGSPQETPDPTVLECLPAEIREATRDISVISVGWSGAGVYLVKTDTAAFVLKIAGDGEPLEVRRRRVRVQMLAAQCGVAPRVIHVDEARAAVVTEFVQDRSFGMLYGTPATRDAAVTMLADTLRSIHHMDVQDAMDAKDAPRASDPASMLDAAWNDLKATGPAPEFVASLVRRVRAMPVPPSDQPPVLSHNDVNPSNIVYDGERIILLDWDACGAGDAYYDLAAASVFFRMDDATCCRFITAHDDVRVDAVPARFRYNQCIVATLCGCIFMRLATAAGFAAGVDRDTIVSLGDIYGMMRAGEFDARSAEGQWKFGLALLSEAEKYVIAAEST